MFITFLQVKICIKNLPITFSEFTKVYFSFFRFNTLNNVGIALLTHEKQKKILYFMTLKQ